MCPYRICGQIGMLTGFLRCLAGKKSQPRPLYPVKQCLVLGRSGTVLGVWSGFLGMVVLAYSMA